MYSIFVSQVESIIHNKVVIIIVILRLTDPIQLLNNKHIKVTNNKMTKGRTKNTR